MQLEVAVLSKAGGREPNEDACGFWSGPDTWFCVLSDGVGGHGGGDIAAKLVVTRTLDWFRQTPECSAETIEAALRSANLAVIDEQKRSAQLANMRATAVVLAVDIRRNLALWAHLGDSRLYCFRKRRLIAQTRDHSVVQSMVEAGYIQPSDLRHQVQRSKLLAGLGDEENFQPAIQTTALSLQEQDTFLLCSDGLWEYVEESEMERTLGASMSAEEWTTALENIVLEHGCEGQDNYSAIVVSCTDPEQTRL